jgi:predicted PurR-regulated permease PerM
MNDFNNRLKQVVLLLIITLLLVTTVIALRVLIPGMLGAITLYVISRSKYFQLVYSRKWRKGWTATLYLLFYLVVIGIPIYLGIVLLRPKLNDFLADPERYVRMVETTLANLQQKVGRNLFSPATVNNLLEKLSALIPELVNSTTNLLINLVVMLFLLYHLLANGSEIEKYMVRLTPLKHCNIQLLTSETKKSIKANAMGIPIISLIQGLVAAVGYYIFKVPEPFVWGLLTGICAFFPLVGTMIVWVPIVIYLYTTGESWDATALMLYSVIITGNVDYLARMTLLKKFGDVHPVVTVLGLISGLTLFGFIGLIFGPLLISYIGILVNIYLNEFSHQPDEGTELKQDSQSRI